MNGLALGRERGLTATIPFYSSDTERLRAATIILMMLAALVATSAFAERRVALVIGNGGYRQLPKLDNPRNDAEDMARELGNLGFEVVGGVDLDHSGFVRALREFERRTRTATAAVFYYAGHGIQVDNENYLVPVDAEIGSKSDIYLSLLSMSDIIAQFNENVRTGVIVLDACRDDPFVALRTSGRSAVPISRGLGRIETPTGFFVAYATHPGRVAEDGTGRRNSPFSEALLKHIRTPGTTVSDVFMSVRADVTEMTGGRQVPWDVSSLTQPFSFAPAAVSANMAAAPLRASAASAGGDILGKFEVARSIASADVWLAFIREFENDEANTFYVTVARAELVRMGATPPSAPAADMDDLIQKQFDRARTLDSELAWSAFLHANGSTPDHLLVRIARARVADLRSRRAEEQFAADRRGAPHITAAAVSDPEETDDGVGLVAKDEAVPGTDAVLPSLSLPMQGKVISAFGATAPANGIVISAPRDTPVTAAADGIVVYAGDGLSEYGNVILIRHADGLVTVYGNMAGTNVTRGQTVRRGEAIGLSGSDGDGSGLIFEVRRGSHPVDPSLYIE